MYVTGEVFEYRTAGDFVRTYTPLLTIYDPSFNYELINSIFKQRYGFDAKGMFNEKTLRKDLSQAMKDRLNEMWAEVNLFLHRFETELVPGDLLRELH